MKLDEVTTSVTSNSILAILFFFANHFITSIYIVCQIKSEFIHTICVIYL